MHKWAEMQKLFQKVTKLFEAHFPGVPIINSFGNNDFINNAEMPGDDNELSF